MKILYVIPARGGSKGIPFKNIKHLNGKPLICYSIDVARELTTDEHICVSTDDDEIRGLVEGYGLNVPFRRPEEFSTDQASSNDVLLHALDFYEKKGLTYDLIVLLQPTSPLRSSRQVLEAVESYREDLEMVVSVKVSHAPVVLCSENADGFVELTFNKEGMRRQDAATYYEYNGAIYVINARALRKSGLKGFCRIKKYVMDAESSVDIDTYLDWTIAETLLKQRQQE
jgi:N-acylneuraminate cytidylyltransferase